MMYKLIIAALITLLLGACGKTQDIELQDIEGNRINFSELDQEWIVINYWASWCKPCYVEIPELNAFVAANREQVLVLGVSYDRVPSEQIPNIANDMGIEFATIAGDPTAILGIPHVDVLPSTYIFNKEGKLITALYGEQTQASLEETLGIHS